MEPAVFVVKCNLRLVILSGQVFSTAHAHHGLVLFVSVFGGRRVLASYLLSLILSLSDQLFVKVVVYLNVDDVVSSGISVIRLPQALVDFVSIN